MKHRAVPSLLNWVRCLALVGAAWAGSAQAVVYTGVWDPAYGAPFADLGWRGVAHFSLPGSCEPGNTVDLTNSIDCGGAAVVTDARVEFYDIHAAGVPTLAAMDFDPTSLVLDTLRFVNGDLTELTSLFSNRLPSGADLSAFGVSANVTFSLQFTLAGPRLSWQGCRTSSTNCEGGFNDGEQFPVRFVITREADGTVPEPGALGLSSLALAILWRARRRHAQAGLSA